MLGPGLRRGAQLEALREDDRDGGREVQNGCRRPLGIAQEWPAQGQLGVCEPGLFTPACVPGIMLAPLQSLTAGSTCLGLSQKVVMTIECVAVRLTPIKQLLRCDAVTWVAKGALPSPENRGRWGGRHTVSGRRAAAAPRLQDQQAVQGRLQHPSRAAAAREAHAADGRCKRLGQVVDHCQPGQRVGSTGHLRGGDARCLCERWRVGSCTPAESGSAAAESHLDGFVGKDIAARLDHPDLIHLQSTHDKSRKWPNE